MSILKWANRNMNLPFWELERMRNHMENIYSTLAGGLNQLRKNYTGVFPLINLSEDDEKLYLVAELPGADPAALDISVKGDTLTLRGEVKASEADTEVNYHRREREGGSFRRSLTLPVKVEVEGIEAGFKNGVLTLTMPKAAEAKAHQISIKNE